MKTSVVYFYDYAYLVCDISIIVKTLLRHAKEDESLSWYLRYAHPTPVSRPLVTLSLLLVSSDLRLQRKSPGVGTPSAQISPLPTSTSENYRRPLMARLPLNNMKLGHDRKLNRISKTRPQYWSALGGFIVGLNL